MALKRVQVSRSAGAEFASRRGLFRLDGLAEKRAPVLLGFSAEGNGELAADVIREWMSVKFEQSFEASPVAGESSLAIAAFYDEIDRCFGDRILIAALRLDSPDDVPDHHRAARSGIPNMQAVDELKPITWPLQGFVRAILNRGNGKAQVTLDDVPGALTFDATPAPRPAEQVSGTANSKPLVEASACYAFGWADGFNSDVLVRLRNKIESTTAAGQQR